MVFENVTLFELHLENSRFSAVRRGEDGEGAEAYEDEAAGASDGGGRGLGRALGALFLLAIVGLVVRRFRSRDDEDAGGEETEGIAIEQAADQ